MRIADRLAKLEARANTGAADRAEEAAHAEAFDSHMTRLADKLPPQEAAETRSFRDALLRTGDAFLIKAFGYCEHGDWKL